MMRALGLIKMAALLAALLVAGSAHAQLGYGKVEQPWYLQGKISGGISVGSSSAATALPANGQVAWICNTGSADAYLAFGTANTVTATAGAGTWLKAGTCGSYDLNPFGVLFTYVATISGTSTTLTVETGIGVGPAQLTVSSGSNPLPIAQGGTPFHVANAGGNSPCTLTINAGAAGTYIYITDFWVTGSGATAASNVVVIYSGLAGGTSYDSLAVPAGVTTQIPLLEHHLTYPWQAAAAATQVQITVPALGSGNTAVACHVNGFYL